MPAVLRLRICRCVGAMLTSLNVCCASLLLRKGSAVSILKASGYCGGLLLSPGQNGPSVTLRPASSILAAAGFINELCQGSAA